MTPEMQQQLRIRQLVENWAVYRDAGLWDRFRTVWHDDGVMMATWFQGPFEDFIRVTIEGWNKGVSILHFLGGSAIDVQGVRAYQAARAGIEWGLYQQLPVQRANPPTYATCAAVFGTSGTFTFPLAATTLQGFTVTVTCVPTADPHGGPTVYTIRSTACNSAGGCPSAAPGNLYVERRLEVSF
jgi:hypothetical protein